jgi:hypothetical protein
MTDARCRLVPDEALMWLPPVPAQALARERVLQLWYTR